jgi:hypothetical protein
MIYSTVPGDRISIITRGIIVITATATKSTGYQESTLVPRYLLATLFASRLARILWRAANPTR